MKALQTANDAIWKQRFRAPALLWTDVARAAPTRGLAVTNQSGVYQLYAWQVPAGQLRRLTHRPSGKMSGLLSPDGRFIYYLDDQSGNEIGHVVRVPFEGGELEDVTPTLPPYSSNHWGLSLAGNRLALNVVTRDGFHLYAIDLDETGALSPPRLLRHSALYAAGPLLSRDGGLAVWHITERTRTTRLSLAALNADSGRVAGELWDGPDSNVVGVCFSPLANDARVLASSNRSGVHHPLIWNPLTGERADLPIELDGELRPLDWSMDGQSLLMSQFSRAAQQLYRYDLNSGKLTRLNHPPGAFGQWSTAYFAGAEIFAHREDSTHPLRLAALDMETGAETRTVLTAAEVPPSHAWQSVILPSSDGQMLQGWLGLPDERERGPFPAILHMHGGPFSEMTEAFSPSAQAWIDHGLAFLSINYRGSTTFGREFQDKILGAPGRWELEDMVAAREWLVEQGIALPHQILLTGGSYGGYLTLLACGRHPDLWAGGIAQRAIADWAVCYEDEKDTHRGMQAALFGGTPQEKAEQHAVSSPITYAESVQAPVLVIQGRNDTRTPARQMENYVARMQSLGKSIEIHWYAAGHMEMTVEQGIENMELMLRFAFRILGPSHEC